MIDYIFTWNLKARIFAILGQLFNTKIFLLPILKNTLKCTTVLIIIVLGQTVFEVWSLVFYSLVKKDHKSTFLVKISV